MTLSRPRTLLSSPEHLQAACSNTARLMRIRWSQRTTIRYARDVGTVSKTATAAGHSHYSRRRSFAGLGEGSTVCYNRSRPSWEGVPVLGLSTSPSQLRVIERAHESRSPLKHMGVDRYSWCNARQSCREELRCLLTPDSKVVRENAGDCRTKVLQAPCQRLTLARRTCY